MVEYLRNLMNGFLYFLYFLRKSFTLPVYEYFHLYNGDINTCAPTLLIAVVRVQLNGA